MVIDSTDRAEFNLKSKADNLCPNGTMQSPAHDFNHG